MAVIIRGPGREPGSLEEAGHWQPAVWPPCQASPPAPTSQEPSCQWKLRSAAPEEMRAPWPDHRGCRDFPNAALERRPAESSNFG